jgi:hypothetical protein
MARPTSSSSGADRPDPLRNAIIDKLMELTASTIKASTRPESAVELTGYLGGSSGSDGRFLLYPQLDLGCYYLISEADLVAPLPDAAPDPTVPIKIWIRASAQIEVVHTCAASFLSGGIASTLPITPRQATLKDGGPDGEHPFISKPTCFIFLITLLFDCLK